MYFVYFILFYRFIYFIELVDKKFSVEVSKGRSDLILFEKKIFKIKDIYIILFKNDYFRFVGDSLVFRFYRD